MGVLFENIGHILMAIIAFGILVVVHEFGHFILAKINDVRVDEFSIGMGPKLFGIKGKETEYKICLLPIGGYVKMYGEDDEVTSVDPRAYANKNSWQKLSIVLAGPIMNIFLAIFLFGLVGNIEGIHVPTVSDTIKDSPAYTAGVEKGDTIKFVDDKKITTWNDFATEVILSDGKELKVTIERNGDYKDINLTPAFSKEENQFLIGIYPELKTPTIGEAFKYGVDQTISLTKQTFQFFGRLFKGKVSSDDFGGPISIIRISTAVARQGVANLMLLGAYLSIQLAIFNIIPFPALDGGWTLILILQIITRREFNKEVIARINYYGYMALMGLMIFMLVKDIVNPIQF
ncbi:RIP metalloprotease RseP [Clostridium senegalense]|uniref:RIP metalloprotease RseP n=1 Tax=Clostridium senegalense TaxID=1465809 RepID=UPI00028A3A62|nr:RIP metalloprotease RseP [Clostridium senegalense]